MELDKETLQYIKDLIEKKAKLEVQIEQIKKCLEEICKRPLIKDEIETFITALKYVLGEE